jgi:hypothetical protein
MNCVEFDEPHVRWPGITGIEQNPETGSRWAQLAREGKKVMQFLRNGRYLAVVVDRQVFTYDSGSVGSL